MALNKAIVTPFNVEAKYWRITRINENFNDGVEVYLAGYLDKQSRMDGKEPLEYRTFHFEERDATRASLYELLVESKLDEEGNETNPFADATEI